MSNENYLDKVYTVGESDPDQGNNSSGDETDRDPRRGGQEFYDAISDPARKEICIGSDLRAS